jgi:hypothetical protein
MQPHPSMPHSNPDSHAVERSGIERRQLIRRGEFERRTPEDRRGVEPDAARHGNAAAMSVVNSRTGAADAIGG